MVLVPTSCHLGRLDVNQKILWVLTILYGNWSPPNTTTRHSRSNVVSRIARENTIDNRIDWVLSQGISKT